jgi:molecular chaperone DnaK
MPQIDVNFDIDANGILNVSAKDKKTGKEKNIVIKASSGLSDAEIQQMIREAEENADADKKARSLIEARNGAESQLHTLKKDLADYGDKITDAEKTEIESVIKTVEEAVAGNDADAINDAVSKVFAAVGPLIQKKTEAEQAKAQPQQNENGDTVVDAEFKEV